jgi:hypothetical protein
LCLRELKTDVGEREQRGGTDILRVFAVFRLMSSVQDTHAPRAWAGGCVGLMIQLAGLKVVVLLRLRRATAPPRQAGHEGAIPSAPAELARKLTFSIF